MYGKCTWSVKGNEMNDVIRACYFLCHIDTEQNNEYVTHLNLN